MNNKIRCAYIREQMLFQRKYLRKITTARLLRYILFFSMGTFNFILRKVIIIKCLKSSAL